MGAREPRLVEIEPGEIRRLCIVCDEEVHGRNAYCDRHKNHKVNDCSICASPTSGTICRKCREGRVVQMRDNKRGLTEEDRPLVEKWWNEGMSTREIGKRLGLSSKDPGTIISRRRTLAGWDLPYRAPWAADNAKNMRRKKAERKKVVA